MFYNLNIYSIFYKKVNYHKDVVHFLLDLFVGMCIRLVSIVNAIFFYYTHMYTDIHTWIYLSTHPSIYLFILKLVYFKHPSDRKTNVLYIKEQRVMVEDRKVRNEAL